MRWEHDGTDLPRPKAGSTATLASDSDRDTAARLLNEAFAQGRLTADEHDDRVRAAYAARTWDELARLTDDLPGPAGAAEPEAAGIPGNLHSSAAELEAAGIPGNLHWCLLCALLICCPPAGIAWLVARRRSRADHVLTAGARPWVSPGGGPVPDGNGRHAEDR